MGPQRGGNHSIALTSDGAVLAWGLNGNGQLGDSTRENPYTPMPVFGLGSGPGVVAIAAGGAHSLALKSDGTVLAWGGNAAGQLGINSRTDQTTFVPVFGLGSGSGVVAIAAGGGHSLALNSDGTVLAWGSDVAGQLGDGPNPTTNLSPSPVAF